jgi:hypothetical protein
MFILQFSEYLEIDPCLIQYLLSLWINKHDTLIFFQLFFRLEIQLSVFISEPLERLYLSLCLLN